MGLGRAWEQEFPTSPWWSHCRRSVDHIRHCKATAVRRGARWEWGASNPVLSTSAPLQTGDDALYPVRFSMAAPHLNSIPLPSHCTGNLHNSKQHKSLLIKVLQQNWNGNKKQGWLCEHSSYWSVCIITVSFKHKKKYIICCLSLSEWMRMLVHTF